MKRINSLNIFLLLVLFLACAQEDSLRFECEVLFTEQSSTGDVAIDSVNKQYSSTTSLEINKKAKTLTMEGRECSVNSDTSKNLYGCKLLNEDAYEQSVEILFNEEDLSLNVKVVSIQRAYAETLGFLDLTKVASSGYGSCKKS
jgi:hypothetical protein